jgi:hypothetical protein
VSETDIQAAILAALQALGCVVWRNHAGSVRVRRGYMHLSPEGTPDIVGYTPWGAMLGIEVKVAKGRVSEAQRDWRDRAAAAGCVVGIARSVAEAVDLVAQARPAKGAA